MNLIKHLNFVKKKRVVCKHYYKVVILKGKLEGLDLLKSRELP